MLLLLILIGVATLAIFCYVSLVRYYNFWTYKGVPQGKTVLLFGENWATVMKGSSSADMVQNAYNKCPGTRYTGIYSFIIPLLAIKDIDLLKQITVKDFEYFTDHVPFMPEELDPLWGKNLFALQGKKWREMRTILSPSFTSSKMKTMFLLMEECAENFVQHFLKKKEDVITLEMKDTFTRYTNDIIASTAFGLKVDSLADPENEFYSRGKEATNIGRVSKTLEILLVHVFPPITKVRKITLFSERVSQFFRKVIDDTLRIREEQGIVRPDMIHLLMEARKGSQDPDEKEVIDTGFATVHEVVEVNKEKTREKITTRLTNEDITAQALVFFFAGFDSVASLMCFTSYELAINKDIQDKLRTEVQDTFRECDGKLTYEALMKMKYLDMVVSETLRKWPNNLAIDRYCTKPYTIQPTLPGEKPVHLEPGNVLWIPIFAIHRDPEHYPDPDRFDPERFNDENKSKIKPYSYLPFGLGPRNCIGSRFALLETKTVLFHIMLHFEIVPIEKTVIPLKISNKTFQLNSEGGVWLGLKRIAKS